MGLGPRGGPATPPRTPPVPPVVPAAGRPAFPLMDRAAILAWQPAAPTLVRLADRPAVFLLGFPDLSSQARAMNRMAALIEKGRAPRDRVLDDAQLAQIIAADGETPDTYYYGHNYALPDMERFYALARAGNVALNDGGALAGGAAGGDPHRRRARPAGPDHPAGDRGPFRRGHARRGAGARGRPRPLLHRPGLCAYVMHVWRTVFTESERAAVRGFLAREGYDTDQEVLMANEAMAYFVCTPDRRFFDPRRDVGMDEAQAARLRAALAGP